MVNKTGAPSNEVRRHLAMRAQVALKTARIVSIVGPRQAGKSTLVEHQIPTT